MVTADPSVLEMIPPLFGNPEPVLEFGSPNPGTAEVSLIPLGSPAA